MAKYVYTGWGPETGPDGELVRPFDEREFGEQPTWGRWAEIIQAGEASQSPLPEAIAAPPDLAPPPGGLFETPGHLAAQGILARDVQPLQPVKPLEGGI